ncbi:MAG: hypothetical protein U0228_06885 [Myxococcaceae bacterium]
MSGSSLSLDEVLDWLRASALGPKLVLRGSLLSEQWLPGRKANDVDVLVDGEWNPATLTPVVRELFAPMRDVACVVTTIWAETEFPGVRASLGRGGVAVQVDFGWGEQLAAEPVPLVVRGHSWRTVVPEVMFGWKTHSLVEHGPRGKWHAKTVADLALFHRHVKLDPALAKEAIVRSFATQRLSLSLLDALFDDPTWGMSRGSRGKWKSYRKKAPWVTFTLEEALTDVRAALGPLLRPGR